MSEEAATVQIRLPRKTYAALAKAAEAHHATVETFVAQQVAAFLMMTSGTRSRKHQPEPEPESSVGQYL